jgi:hypothetical protein
MPASMAVGANSNMMALIRYITGGYTEEFSGFLVNVA